VFKPTAVPAAAGQKKPTTPKQQQQQQQQQPAMPQKSAPLKKASGLADEAWAEQLRGEVSRLREVVADLERVNEEAWDECSAAELNLRKQELGKVTSQLDPVAERLRCKAAAVLAEQETERKHERVAELVAERAMAAASKDAAIKSCDFKAAKLAKDKLLKLDAEMAQLDTEW
jgi:hypothetical protein